MADATYTPPAVIWVAVSHWMTESRKPNALWHDRDKGVTAQARYKECIQAVIDVVEDVLVTLPIEGAKHWIGEAPQRAQNSLWKYWCSHADLSGFSLAVMDKQARDLPPAIMVLVWTAWVKQADLSHYTHADFSKVARHWPMQVNAKIAAVVFKLWPHLKGVTIRQLSNKR